MQFGHRGCSLQHRKMKAIPIIYSVLLYRRPLSHGEWDLVDCGSSFQCFIPSTAYISFPIKDKTDDSEGSGISKNPCSQTLYIPNSWRSILLTTVSIAIPNQPQSRICSLYGDHDMVRDNVEKVVINGQTGLYKRLNQESTLGIF